MLRGKFGQIGKDFRDGHVTMDAFEQAAFRDHIRSGERIMFLASTGQLKHKRIRNTIAAEPTPRSSCPSSAEAAPAARAAGAATSDPRTTRRNADVNGGNRGCNPTSKAATRAASPGNAPVELRNKPEASPAEPDHANRNPAENVGDSSPRSHQRLLMSAVYRRQEDASGHDDLSTSSKAHVDGRPKAARATSAGRRKLGSARPQSARGGVGRRPRSPVKGSVAGTVRRLETNDDTAVKRRVAKEIPLHVGPEITAPSAEDIARAWAGYGERSTAVRRRPASAGGAAAAGKKWEAELQSRTRVVHRGFGERGRGDCVGRDLRRKSGGKARPTPKARAPGVESTARTPDGSFAESVIKSARPFADYSYIIATNTATIKKRPKSAGAAITTAPPLAAAAAAPAFDPGSRESHAVAADTQFMPVGAIHKAFKGRRLAAVQAWDPQAAAAVRAARAEALLRRKRLGKGGAAGTPISALASDRRRPGETGVEGRSGDEVLRCHDESKYRRRAGAWSARRACGKEKGRGGEAGGGCGTNAVLGKDCRRDRASRKSGPASCAIDGAEDGCHGSGGSGPGGGASDPIPAELDKHKKRVPCFSRPSTANGSTCRGSTLGSARGDSAKSSGATLSTARASTATGYSSCSRGNGSTSGRSASTGRSYSGSTSRSRSDDIAAEEKRTRLLAELETLRRRMADAEGLLREVDTSLRAKPRKRPGTATSRATTIISGRTRASLVATPGNTSAKSSAGYGAFNLGERRMSPLVVTHPANAFPEDNT